MSDKKPQELEQLAETRLLEARDAAFEPDYQPLLDVGVSIAASLREIVKLLKERQKP